ncbi:hypothetical protein GCM10007147_03330 [Nocardiopsis kunsanensis]|uniref:HTH merR-type domain-containing protein n=1 Tax=Nocardiopsis kunsanensis TaxID=141693 RepID=A0A918X7N5_9ACTN|nr:MerR family transcriptional regulator [Nocardiopsis kunsanensis]GHD15683.1 hypothetical protein GCM10007147_03330 [Nocardiopsis kunsanensis]
MPDLMKFRIGDLAKHIGVSARSLHHYEQKGLLSPSRDENGYRVYDQLSAVRADNIKQLFEVGLTSADVIHYIENGCLDRPLAESPHCPAELDTVRERLSGLDERLARLQSLRERLASHHAELACAIGPEQAPESHESGTPGACSEGMSG